MHSGRMTGRSAMWSAMALCLAVAFAAQAQNWPTWRGKDMTGLAAAGDPPITFSETENVKWKIPVPGRGHSTPVIWGDRILLMTAIETDIPGEPVDVPAVAPPPPPSGPGGRGGRRGPPDPSRFGIKKAVHEFKFDVLCFSRSDGSMQWQKTVRREVPHEGFHRDHGYASCSPVTDGTHVWAFFGSRGLHCLDMDGNIVWTADLGRMRTRVSFGEGSSPALAGSAVIALLDQEGDSSIVALNKATGDVLWRKARDERTSWTTPVPIELDGRTQIIVNGRNRTRSYDLATGDVLWQCGGQTENVIPAPVVGFGMVYCASGFRGAAMQAIALGRTGELTNTDAVVWEVKEHTPYVPSPLLYGELLYMFARNEGRLTCLDAKTGRVHYSRQQIAGMRNVYASPVGVSGRIYLAGRKGTVAVLKNSPKLEVLAVNKLDEGFDASPAIVGDALFLRGGKSLYCIAK